MSTMLTILIAVLASLSYISGVSAVFRGKYKPSIYSRLIWLLIATNSLIGVLLLKNSPGTIALAAIAAVGCLLMLIGSWKYSVRTFGRTELYCTVLLALSVIVWIVFNNPVVNVALGLAAHFIGAVPSLIQVVKKPSSEHVLFWLFFALASILAFVQADKSAPNQYIFAAYYACFDSVMTILAARQYLGKHR